MDTELEALEFLDDVALSDELELEEFNPRDVVEAEAQPARSPDVQGFGSGDIVTITARLARILAQEADYLEEMKISKIADLQKEKLMLADALQTIRKEIHKNPAIMKNISDREREELRTVIGIFNQILDENYRRLSIARAVNEQVVKAVQEAVCEHAKNDVYDAKGWANGQVVNSLSLSLDQKV